MAWITASIGLATAAVYGWVWGGLHAGPAIIDEAAYLLQARIYASGHWTAPARPLPEFFEQLYVIVSPFVAAKYPPGHSLTLAVGELMGSPALVVLLVNALSGVLVFCLAVKFSGLLTGCITWLIWLLAPINLTFRPSYLSNVTTTALWLISWWALDRWWENGQQRWLLTVAAAVAGCAITRPLTGLVLAVPIGLVTLHRVRQRGLWNDLGAALALSIVVFAVLPLANQQTTGKWLEMPWTTYTKLYTPYDHLGFGFDSTPPESDTGPQFERLAELRRPLSERHTLAALPSIAFDRLREILRGALGRGPTSLIPLAVLGLPFVSGRVVFAVTSSLFLVLAHLAYAHHARWTPYYLETLPVLAIVAAIGLSWLGAATRNSYWRRLLALGTWVFFGLWLVGAVRQLPRARVMSQTVHKAYDAFQLRLRRIPDPKAIVFVQKVPWHTLAQSLVFNVPNLDTEPIWIVHDRGSDNSRLLALAPDRAAYRYEEERRKLTRLRLVSDSTDGGSMDRSHRNR